MEIVYNEAELQRYMHDAVKVSNESRYCSITFSVRRSRLMSMWSVMDGGL